MHFCRGGRGEPASCGWRAEKGHGLALMALFGMNFDSSLTTREAKSRDQSVGIEIILVIYIFF